MPLVRRLTAVLISVTVAAAIPRSNAAPKPLRELTAQEVALRAAIQPLREGHTDGEALQPLRDWLDARVAAGKGRQAERELHRGLKRIHDELQDDLLQAATWIHRLQVQRSKLYKGMAEENAGLERTLERYSESPPVPDIEELLPGLTGLPESFLASFGASLPNEEFDPADVGPPDLQDMDEPRLLNRITLDLTMLGHLLHECDNEYEKERDRHRAAVDALATFLKAYRKSRSE